MKATAGGLAFGEVTQDQQTVSVAMYLCSVQYPWNPRDSGYLSDAQVEFLYDYFTVELAPCLKMLGYSVFSQPDKQSFVASNGHLWNPYHATSPHIEDLDFVDFKCPPLPNDPYGPFPPGGRLTVKTAAIALVLAAAAVLVSGCAVEPGPIPTGFTDEERADFVRRDNDARWRSLFSADSPIQRPDIEVLGYADPLDWAAIQTECMSDAGFGGQLYTSAGGISLAPDPGMEDAVNLAFYVCTSQFPFDPGALGYLSPAQLDYLFAQFTERITPCLQLLGHYVPGVPNRQAFLNSYQNFNMWNPYALVRPTEGGWDYIDFRCPPVPHELGLYHP